MSDWAEKVVAGLREKSLRLVLAESCTCGRVAAQLGLVPGVSQFLCGSWVVYRPASKESWLGLSAEFLERVSTESHLCSQALAEAALQRTAEAHLVAAITGDLGPGVDAGRDGRVYVVAGYRQEGTETVDWHRVDGHLKRPDRVQRQAEAADLVLQLLLEVIALAGTRDQN